MPGDSTGINVVTIASYQTSLETWRAAGILSRELEVIERLGRATGSWSLITYGAGDGRSGEGKSRGGWILGRPRWLPFLPFSLLAPFVHWRTLAAADVIRAYQLRGAWTAAIASLIHRKPFILRTGYIWSDLKLATSGRGLRYRLASMLERFALRRARVVIAASERDRDLLMSTHGVAESRLHVIPNPIDIDLFSPDGSQVAESGLVTYVGRLESEKDVGVLIEALRLVSGGRLRIVGDGSLRDELGRLAEGQPVEFVGLVPNEELPRVLTQGEVFALSSRYEGTPKALLEAMACAVAVVATRSQGTEAVIEDGKTGLLAGPGPDAMAECISKILDDSELRRRLGENARSYIVNRHSLDSAVREESRLIRLAPGISTEAPLDEG